MMFDTLGQNTKSNKLNDPATQTAMQIQNEFTTTLLTTTTFLTSFEELQ